MLMQTIERYLAIRRVAGFRLRVAEGFLRSYARFASERGEAYVRAQTVLDWVALVPSASQRGRRLEAVTIFAQYAQAEDTRHEVPPRGIFRRQRPFYRPFIFTEDQIHQLLEQAARLPPPGSLRPWTYCTLFSLLAVTGLRISEALALRFEDITADGLLIRQTKFHKSRLVPLHPSAQAGLGRYLRSASCSGVGRRSRIHLKAQSRPALPDGGRDISDSNTPDRIARSRPATPRPRIHDLTAQLGGSCAGSFSVGLRSGEPARARSVDLSGPREARKHVCLLAYHPAIARRHRNSMRELLTKELPNDGSCNSYQCLSASATSYGTRRQRTHL